MKTKLAVVVPMFNEEGNAERCVAEITKVLAGESQLIVVNDGSSDATLQRLEHAKTTAPALEIVSYSPNRGYGSALLAGAERAETLGYEFALFMDSDLTNDPSLIREFDTLFATDKYDLVKASRYVDGGGMEGVPAYRQAFTITGNWVARHLFRMGIRDCTNGFRAVRLEMLRGLELQERGFASILEELYWLKRRGARAVELPYVLTARTDESGSKFSYRPAVLWRYLKYAIRAALLDI